MKPNNDYKLIIASFMFLTVLACSGTFTATFPSPTSPAFTETATVAPAVTPTPPLTLSSVSLYEKNQAPNYEIKAQVPTLGGSAEARVVNFNTAMMNLVNTEINAFKKNVSELTINPVSPNSSLDVTYALTLQRGDLWSFKFDFSGYSAGAAHPYLYSLTVNYNLAQGRQLILSDLFLPNSNYLEVISNYCIAELSKQPGFEGPFREGAAPTPENYRNWNITTDGLMITFDTYQVAPGASGPQTVTVPYSELQVVIDPQSPLAGLTR